MDNTIHVLVICPGEAPQEAQIREDLTAMQQMVGGLIEVIYPFEEPVALVCNEEGKLQGLPLNRALQDEDGKIYDVIAGTFFLCGAPPEEENFASLTEEQVRYYTELFQAPEQFIRVGGRLLVVSENKF